MESSLQRSLIIRLWKWGWEEHQAGECRARPCLYPAFSPFTECPIAVLSPRWLSPPDSASRDQPCGSHPGSGGKGGMRGAWRQEARSVCPPSGEGSTLPTVSVCHPGTAPQQGCPRPRSLSPAWSAHGHPIGASGKPTHRRLAQVILLGQLSHLPLVWPEEPAHRDHHWLVQLLFL